MEVQIDEKWTERQTDIQIETDGIQKDGWTDRHTDRHKNWSNTKAGRHRFKDSRADGQAAD